MKRIKIEKLVEGGQGFAEFDGETYFVWNALPNEEVDAEIVNKRKGIYEGVVADVLEPSPHRISPKEDHFLSCSPWQIMDFEYENEQKIAIAAETYRRIGRIDLGSLEIVTDKVQSGYRNKMEFSFVDKEEKISLAFFKRGQKVRVPIDGCELASKEINETAKKILDWVNSTDMTMRNLKAVIIRSNQKGETIAGLFIKDKMVFEKYPILEGGFVGFNLYYSTHKSPASVITEVLYQEGQDFLIEEIAGKSFKYGINSFFQINMPVFEMALKDIGSFVSEKDKIVDIYSGVGSIGLCVGANQLIESNQEAVDFAKENIFLNNADDCCAILASAEKALDHIEKDKVIVFDPPRAGLHQKVIDRVLETRPKKIIYMSCNIATHARDIGLLQGVYDIKFLKLYNFFPRTPHIEGLCMLELKTNK